MFIYVRSMSLKFLQLISEQSEQELDPQQRNYNMKTLYLSDIMEFLLGNHSKERNKKILPTCISYSNDEPVDIKWLISKESHLLTS